MRHCKSVRLKPLLLYSSTPVSLESEYLKFAEVKLRRVAAALAVNFEGIAGQLGQVFVGRTHVEGQDAPL